MSVSYYSHFVVGIPITKIFINIREHIDEYEEHNTRGQKTGKLIKEEKLIGTLLSGKEVIISEIKEYGRWCYDFYSSLGFDGGEYLDDDSEEDIRIGLHYADHEETDLNQIIVGIQLHSAGGYSNDSVVRLDEEMFDETIKSVREQLNNLYGYTSEIGAYIINYVSY